MMIVRRPVIGRAILAISIKFIHHKECDNESRRSLDDAAEHIGKDEGDRLHEAGDGES